MKNFEGYYFKHTKGDEFLAVIAGRSKREAFVQIVTKDRALYVPYPVSAFSYEGIVRVGDNRFSREGISLCIPKPEIRLEGELRYGSFIPLESDIMGPFRYLPMQCRHRVVSMQHTVDGSIRLGDEAMNFDGGTGYIEGDEGSAFPKGYLWLQSNDFDEPMSVMVSIAEIPFLGVSFTGCIAAIRYRGREYRLATYRGVRIVSRTQSKVELRQGEYRLLITLDADCGHSLRAPARGAMNRTITETPACPAVFRFYDGEELLFEKASARTSFEYAYGGASEATAAR